MEPDLLLIIGIVLAVLSVPSMLSAFADRRTPRVAAVVAIVGGGLIVWAFREQPGGYTLEEIPEVFVRVVAQFI
ncbi:hypothetical protein [Roseovarius indicus]|uniref:50S ribosomal protein L35 n=1 Tax=Roseovarius indicus TaxID=540747 RepID=A0A0T5P9B8_9RHOB|nr:hypothetical protein [Roseovarius indicus]KRS17701.1 hypothetical protein XM52_11875 [Roseovarius indicus]OAO05334.1 hypothetical protein A8B76_02500 [Roseovarius indicus]QEW24549.1 hypothetical protein RIdsm_00329 [Roseovarius indicus]SFE25438.1 hypothetical protein SAMN04488031_107120 [Roseovarius indicus]